MAQIAPPPQGLVFYGLTADREETSLIKEVTSRLENTWGEILATMDPFFFSGLTDYYSKEMGDDLIKTFILFKRPTTLENISDLKKQSNAIENLYVKGEKSCRRINIDPGILTLYNFCLLTTKGYSHRVYLGCGVYAEVTLRAFKGKLRPLGWTYPDYKTREGMSFLESGRQFLKTWLSDKKRSCT